MDADAWVMIPKVVNKGTECVIDMRPLVLCKNCKKHGSEDCTLWTDAVEFETADDWFCSDGEKDGEQE